MPGVGDAHAIEVFPFAFDPRFRLPLALIGVTPSTARVTVTTELLTARYGPWSCETTLANVIEVCRTGPYRWYTSIGPRGSMVDRGATFGTTPAGGVCMLFRDPVPGLLPFGSMRHTGLTVTVGDPDRFLACITRRAALDG